MERLFPFRWHSRKFIRISSHFANMPWKSFEGTACAFAGYFVRHLPLYSVLPQARGLRRQSSSWCTWLSHAQTTMPHPTLRQGLGVSLGSPLVGRIRARYLTARFPNPPVRTVRAPFSAHGSRDNELRRVSSSSDMHQTFVVNSLRVLLIIVYFPLHYPLGPLPCVWFSHTRTTMPHLTACRASEFRWALACLLPALLSIPSRLSRVRS